MKRWIAGAACALTWALHVAPVAAQEQSPHDEMAAFTAEILANFEVLAEPLGFSQPIFPADVMTGALIRAMPVLSADDERKWDTTFDFDIDTETSTGDLEPDERGRRVLTDAKDCVAPEGDAEVIHFERFTRGEVRGHRCIMSVAGDAGNVWAIYSRTFAEGPDRRLTAFYGVAMSIEGDGETARALVEARIDENVAIAGILADYALEMLLASEASSGMAVTTSLEERAARLQAKLAEIAAPDWTGSPSPGPAE